MAVTEKCVTKILVVQWQSGIMALWYHGTAPEANYEKFKKICF